MNPELINTNFLMITISTHLDRTVYFWKRISLVYMLENRIGELWKLDFQVIMKTDRK